jgi:molecular chaperone GrpE
MKKDKNTEETPELMAESQVEEIIPTPDISDDAADKIEDELEVMSQKCTELNDKNLRLMAEFDNYRKRTLKERIDLLKTAGEKVLVDMLPLVDDFERGLKVMDTSEDVQAVRDGVDLIYSKFISFLLQNGVKAIPTENQTFDTQFHEAITTFPAPSDDMKDKIIDCVAKGYTMNDKVIRCANVVVGK